MLVQGDEFGVETQSRCLQDCFHMLSESADPCGHIHSALSVVSDESSTWQFLVYRCLGFVSCRSR